MSRLHAMPEPSLAKQDEAGNPFQSKDVKMLQDEESILSAEEFEDRVSDNVAGPTTDKNNVYSLQHPSQR